MDQVEHNEKMQIVLQNVEKERKNKYWGIILSRKKEREYTFALSLYIQLHTAVKYTESTSLL